MFAVLLSGQQASEGRKRGHHLTLLQMLHKKYPNRVHIWINSNAQDIFTQVGPRHSTPVTNSYYIALSLPRLSEMKLRTSRKKGYRDESLQPQFVACLSRMVRVKVVLEWHHASAEI